MILALLASRGVLPPTRVRFGSGLSCLEPILRRDIQVNFNQTLDLGLLTPETAAVRSILIPY